MDDGPNQAAKVSPSSGTTPVPHHRAIGVGSDSSEGRRRVGRWLLTLVAALLWLMLVYGLPLQTLQESRRIVRGELAYLLQTGQPDIPTVLDAFDRATEQVLFSVAGPYFILGVAVLFLVAHVVGIKRRLHAVERSIRSLRAAIPRQ